MFETGSFETVCLVLLMSAVRWPPPSCNILEPIGFPPHSDMLIRICCLACWRTLSDVQISTPCHPVHCITPPPGSINIDILPNCPQPGISCMSKARVHQVFLFFYVSSDVMSYICENSGISSIKILCILELRLWYYFSIDSLILYAIWSLPTV